MEKEIGMPVEVVDITIISKGPRAADDVINFGWLGGDGSDGLALGPSGSSGDEC